MTAESGTVLPPFTDSLPMALLRARETVMRMFRPLLAAHGLTEQQWRVLRALDAVEAPLEVGTLAEHTLLLPPSLSRILSNLEARSLVRRRAVPHDQRRAAIALTPSGRAIVRKVAPGSRATYDLIEAQFGPAALKELIATLHGLAEIEGLPARDEAAS